ncbi:MAG: polysaccharide biosynthesis/export family protein [Chitinophagaceae bacterium]|nr:polysaccharide biosynthesis/export family protein [Chitinophagaceae bacterium]
MKSTFILFLSAFLIIQFSSCSPAKDLDYFSYPAYDSSHMFVQESYEVPIKVGDDLSISLSSLKPEYATPYLVPLGKNLTVDDDGYILYPQLGPIKAVGLTRNQLRDLLINKLKVYLVDPVVLVDFANFKITVMGEVAKQGTIDVKTSKINILEAIAQAGDITQYGRKESVTIIREKNGLREFGYVNLLSHNFFTSPYYRLQQNDIIYVRSENKPSFKSQKVMKNISVGTTILGIVSTIAFLIINLTRN